MGDHSQVWQNIHPEVARFTKVLSYDRGGMGQSDKAPIPRTCKDMVEDLRQLLYAADLRPSYINDFGRVGATQYTIRSLLI